MIVYILRHAEAVEAGAAICDEWRYLTEKGRKTTQGVAKRLARHGVKSCLIFSSPLVRAVQTAQIVAETSGRKCRVEINALLQPGGDVAELVEFLHRHEGAKNIMVVGHEPQLGLLAATLLKRPETITLKKAGCVVMEINPMKHGKPAKFCSYIIPGKKPVTSLKKTLTTA